MVPRKSQALLESVTQAPNTTLNADLQRRQLVVRVCMSSSSLWCSGKLAFRYPYSSQNLSLLQSHVSGDEKCCAA